MISQRIWESILALHQIGRTTNLSKGLQTLERRYFQSNWLLGRSNIVCELQWYSRWPYHDFFWIYLAELLAWQGLFQSQGNLTSFCNRGDLHKLWRRSWHTWSHVNWRCLGVAATQGWQDRESSYQISLSLCRHSSYFDYAGPRTARLLVAPCSQLIRLESWPGHSHHRMEANLHDRQRLCL